MRARALDAVRTVWRRHRIDFLGCALAIVYALPTLLYPFGSDQGIHWYLGWALLHGKLPYLSGISGKPPGIFIVHALSIVLFGNSRFSIRLLEIAALPLMGYLTWQCARAGVERAASYVAQDGRVGAATLMTSAAMYTYQDYWNTAHPEFWMTLSLLGALAIALHYPHPLRRAAYCGALCSWAFVIKYTGAAMALPIAAVCGLRSMQQSPRPVRALLQAAGCFLLGAGLLIGLIVLPYALSGQLRPMWEVCVTMTENYMDAAPSLRHWTGYLTNLHRNGTLTWTCTLLWSLGMVRAAYRKRHRELAFGLLAAVLFVAAVGSVLMQRRLYDYHFIAMFPFLVLAACWGLSVLMRARRMLVVTCVLTVAAFSYGPIFLARAPRDYRTQMLHATQLLLGKISYEHVLSGYRRLASADNYDDLLATTYAIKRRARPGDTLCLEGFSAALYQLTQLRCPSRHAIGTFVPMGPPSWQTEYERDMRERPPRFVVSLAYRHFRPRNRAVRARGYALVERHGALLLFEHKPIQLPNARASADHR